MEQKTLPTTITQRHAYIFYPLPLCGFYPHQNYSIGLARSLLLLNLNFLLSIPKSKGRFFYWYLQLNPITHNQIEMGSVALPWRTLSRITKSFAPHNLFLQVRKQNNNVENQ